MGYKGDDLDLRIPHAWGMAPGEPGDRDGGHILEGPPDGFAERPPLGRGPIWVDPLVLSCCNYAFDIAASNHAPEVGVTHLLYAMSRTEGAAETLEARGVRILGLRRDTAAVISSEAAAVPGLRTSGVPLPRRSDEFEEILRRAVARACRYGALAHIAPVNVGDIIDVLLSDVQAGSSGIALLAQHSGWPPRDPSPPPPPPPRRAVSLAAEAAVPLRYAGWTHGGLAHSPPAAFGEPGRGTASEETLIAHEDKGEGSRQARLAGGASFRNGHAGDAGSKETANALARIAEKLEVIESLLPAKDFYAVALSSIGGRLAAIEEALHAQGANAREEAHRAAADRDGVRHRIEAFQEALSGHKMQMMQAYASVNARLEALPVLARAIDGLSSSLPSSLASLSRQRGEIITAFSETARSLTAMAEARHAPDAEAVRLLLGTALPQIEERLKDLAREIAGALGSVDACGAPPPGSPAVDSIPADAGGPGAAAGPGVPEGPAASSPAHARPRLEQLDMRLAGLEAAVARVIGQFDQLSRDISVLYRLTAERYSWRRRFWYWLFGTHDWARESWENRRPATAQGGTDGPQDR